MQHYSINNLSAPHDSNKSSCSKISCSTVVVVLASKMKYLLLCILGLILTVRQSLGIEQTTALRSALLAGYEKDAKPDGKVETKVGLRVTTLDLCPHRQVLSHLSISK